MPFCDLGFFDWEEWVRAYGQVFQFTVLHEFEDLPGKVSQLVYGKVQDFQCCQSADCRWDFGELVVPQAEDFEVAELEEIVVQG